MSERLTVTYRVRSDAAGIEARAKGIAVEQSVEMALEAIDAPAVLSDIVGAVEAIEPAGTACSPFGSDWRWIRSGRMPGS